MKLKQIIKFIGLLIFGIVALIFIDKAIGKSPKCTVGMGTAITFEFDGGIDWSKPHYSVVMSEICDGKVRTIKEEV